MFRNNKIPKLEQVNCLLNSGGCGDAIAAMSAIKYIRDNLPHVELHVWVAPYLLDLAKFLVPGISINSFKDKHKYINDYAAVQMHCQQVDSMAIHLVDFAFTLLVNKQVDIQHKNYVKLNTKKINISKFNLPEKYVVLSPGFTSGTREWLPSSVNATADYIKSKGYEIVFAGNSSVRAEGTADTVKGVFREEIQFDKGINLIDKTTLIECGAIIAKSKGIVGLDCGLLHLAGCTEVPILGLYTTVDPSLRLPIRHNEVGWNCYQVGQPESVECRYCQSNWALLYGWDFRQCIYGDKLCLEQFSIDRISKELDKFL